MALTHVVAVRNGLADYAVDQLDVATGPPDMRITPAVTATTLVVIPLNSSAAFGNATGGTATLVGSPSGTATGADTAAVFIMRDATGSEVFRGAVGTTGSDLNLSSTTIAVDDKVQLTSLTYSSSL